MNFILVQIIIRNICLNNKIENISNYLFIYLSNLVWSSCIFRRLGTGKLPIGTRNQASNNSIAKWRASSTTPSKENHIGDKS